MLLVLSGLSLMFCVIVGLYSFRESFAVAWKGESVGVSQGIAIWGHSDHRNRKLSILRAPNDGGKIVGPVWIGFHYAADSRGFRLIGVPLWSARGVVVGGAMPQGYAPRVVTTFAPRPSDARSAGGCRRFQRALPAESRSFPPFI